MSANTEVNIFVTGATGYIGGAVLLRLLNHARASDFKITALVRSPVKAEKLKLLGVTPVIGSLDDSELLKTLCSKSDVVMSMADADHLSSVQAILSGLKRKFDATATPPVLIHTSGTGVLMDKAAGMHQYDTIWNDADPEQMATLPSTQIHRDVDLEIVDADEEGYLKSYIVLPSTIWGIAQGRLVDLGISNNRSMQIPALVRVSLDRKQGGMVGLGKNLWPNVNIEEQGDLFIILLDAALNKQDTGHGTNGYYFGESGEHSLYDIGKAIADILVDLGIGQSREPTTFTKEEIDKYFRGRTSLGSNSRCRANHSRSLGWNPQKSTVDMLASIRAEVEYTLKVSAQ